MDHIDHAFVNRLSQRLPMFKQRGHGKFNFRCVVCGDSTKNKYKARGWIIDFKGNLRYHCFNDDSCGSSFSYFLKRYDENLYREYRFEKFKEYGDTSRKREVATGPIDLLEHELEPEESHENWVEDLPKISSLSSDHPARKYLDSRQIPKERYDELYWTDRWKELTNRYEEVYSSLDDDEGRIVIPAYNQDNELICFQGRILPGTDQSESRKYMTVKVKDELKIFGLDKIDTKKPVYILEGAFDSFFIPNSLAMLGGYLGDTSGLPEGDYVFVLDNEPRNKSVVNRYKKLANNGHKLVSWLRWKYPWIDVNDCVVNGVDPREIVAYFRANTNIGLMAQLNIQQWIK